jgi:hypothetical protein
MDKRLKTAPELERMIMVEMQRHAICAGVQALTVRATADGTSWEVADIRIPGAVPAACRDICETAAAELRERYDLLSEDQLTPDYDLSLT